MDTQEAAAGKIPRTLKVVRAELKDIEETIASNKSMGTNAGATYAELGQQHRAALLEELESLKPRKAQIGSAKKKVEKLQHDVMKLEDEIADKKGELTAMREELKLQIAALRDLELEEGVDADTLPDFTQEIRKFLPMQQLT